MSAKIHYLICDDSSIDVDVSLSKQSSFKIIKNTTQSIFPNYDDVIKKNTTQSIFLNYDDVILIEGYDQIIGAGFNFIFLSQGKTTFSFEDDAQSIDITEKNVKQICFQIFMCMK